jgi:hypothetical protein
LRADGAYQRSQRLFNFEICALSRLLASCPFGRPVGRRSDESGLMDGCGCGAVMRMSTDRPTYRDRLELHLRIYSFTWKFKLGSLLWSHCDAWLAWTWTAEREDRKSCVFLD